jgi:hypothetical protein
LTIRQYLNRQAVCPVCRARFNPGCALHHHLYFEQPAQPADDRRDFYLRAGEGDGSRA